MAYGRTTAQHDVSWYQEQVNMINGASPEELAAMRDGFDNRYEDAAGQILATYGVNILTDTHDIAKKPGVLQEMKTLILEPTLEDIREKIPCDTPAERQHVDAICEYLTEAWDQSEKAFIVQESFNVANYLPLATMDFPALVKQYIRFLGKELMPIQTASSTNIEQRIITKWLVDNNTGAEYEVPKLYFQKSADGTPLWKKLWNAGKGLRLNNKTVLPLSTIAAAKDRKYSLYQWLLDDADQATTITPNYRTRLAYDFHINYVQINGQKVMLPNGGIAVDIQTGGTFLNGGITEDMVLPVVDATTNKRTGDVVTGVSDMLTGRIDFIKGTVTAVSCGTITGIYVEGHVSNETNLRTIGFREYPEIRKFTIPDGCRFQLPFTVEDFAEGAASLNFNIYNRLVQELITNQEMFEDSDILYFLDEEFEKYNGGDSDIWNLESYTSTEYVDLSPTGISPNFAGDPFEYRTNAIHNALASVIAELCDKGKLDNLGFVIYANPKAARLLSKFTTWTVQKSTDIGGVEMNHSFGILTDSDVPIRVVSSNRVDAYIEIPAYQNGHGVNDTSKEYFFKIVAYPMDKYHIGYKHLRFARHLTNSPENASYADAQNPGGQAVLITASSQYQTIAIQGIQGRVICKNTVLVPDSNAGLVPFDPTKGYTLIASEPADWSSAWTTNYQNNVYTVKADQSGMEAVTAGTAPTWAADTYWTKD